MHNIIFGSWGTSLFGLNVHVYQSLVLNRVYNAAGCDPCCSVDDIVVCPVFITKKLTDCKFKATNVLEQSPIFRPRKRVSCLKLNRVNEGL